eukprot:NODE_3356_length_678_cov_99.883943_g2390_i0.p3 GENE.NODE_3356_length_678_cov_99.883943_g2390_i0~~NODE_3356_length_678_cov_99.883943_g2390_i0.p3  ORF type:complete len:51 (-),score=4.30 NODE_3356_length_678_cov_99.883943_g2390_i0:16-168(-)
MARKGHDRGGHDIGGWRNPKTGYDKGRPQHRGGVCLQNNVKKIVPPCTLR